MTLVRAAFSVMLKLNSQLQKCLQELMDDLDLCNGEDIPLEVGEERKKALISFFVEHVHFSPLL
jgi:hypothetical protein